MIFGHTLAECRKTVTAAVIFLASAVALFVAYDPGIKDAIIVLVGNGFAVAAVFLAPKFSIDDLTKMLGQLVGSVQSLMTFFVVVNPNVWVVVGSVVSLIPIGYAVWKTKNAEPIKMELPPVVFGPPPVTVPGASATTAVAEPPEAAPPATTSMAISQPPPGPPDPPVPPDDRPVE